MINFAFAQRCWTILLKRNLAQIKYSKLCTRLDVLLNTNDKLFYSCQQSLCEKEERKGRQLLTILPGLFISNSGEDIKIDISGLEEGWKIIGNSLMTIKSKDAWNSPENSTDFPCCVFEITHVDETKQLFSCEITASHLNDSAETELVAFFEQANEVMTPPELPIQKNNVFGNIMKVTVRSQESSGSMMNFIAKYLDLLESAGSMMNFIAKYLDLLESAVPAYFQSKPYNLRLLSGVYDVDPRDNKGYSRVLKIEHCALQEFGNQWQLEVKCRPKGSKASSGRWTNIRNIYPDAKVKVKQNYIELTLPTVEDSHEFAVFGTPEVKDKKRMRLGIFGGKATRGQDWNIVGTLFDDTMMAFESLCVKEERKGRQLLTILPGLFISNSGEDIKIDISGLEEGWKIKGNSLMTIKSKDAWNSPENSTDFPCCVFEITHVDETKQLFSCEITASHLNDSAETELVAFFEQANEVMTPPELPIQKNNVFETYYIRSKQYDLKVSVTYYIQSQPYNLRLISGVYDVDPRDNKGYSRVLKIEHCALQEFGNQWQLEVKCRPKGSKASSGRWTNIRNIYPDAKVKVKQNYIELTLPTVEDSHEFAVFGTPEVKDKKRMRLGIFGGKATRGQDWNIVGTLFDDTMLAFESLCEKEERKGRQLLTILPGLFISNSGEDIKIDISGLEEGWKIIGNSLMTIKSKDAWNSPENSTDFPCCVFEITHVDETKQLFSCEITASHLNDSAETELVAFFEQANAVMTPPELPIQKKNVFDLFVFLQMLVFLVECFTGSSFDPQASKKGSVVDQVESFNSN